MKQLKKKSPQRKKSIYFCFMQLINKSVSEDLLNYLLPSNNKYAVGKFYSKCI